MSQHLDVVQSSPSVPDLESRLEWTRDLPEASPPVRLVRAVCPRVPVSSESDVRSAWRLLRGPFSFGQSWKAVTPTENRGFGRISRRRLAARIRALWAVLMRTSLLEVETLNQPPVSLLLKSGVYTQNPPSRGQWLARKVNYAYGLLTA